jgi:hypothetical protein
VESFPQPEPVDPLLLPVPLVPVEPDVPVEALVPVELLVADEPDAAPAGLDAVEELPDPFGEDVVVVVWDVLEGEPEPVVALWVLDAGAGDEAVVEDEGVAAGVALLWDDGVAAGDATAPEDVDEPETSVLGDGVVE